MHGADGSRRRWRSPQGLLRPEIYSIDGAQCGAVPRFDVIWPSPSGFFRSWVLAERDGNGWPEGQAIVTPGTGNRRGDPLRQATGFARQGNFPDCVDWCVLEETVSATLNS
jgi:hypothetical protein